MVIPENYISEAPVSVPDIAQEPVPDAPAPVESSHFGRFTAVAVICGALATGCSAGSPDSHPSPAPSDTRPAVAAIGQYDAQYPEQQYINTQDFTTPLQQAIQAQQLPDYGMYGLPANSDMPINDSAPLFSVVFGKDGQLRVQDQTKGAVDFANDPSGQVLLGAVKEDAPLISGVMRAKKLHEVRFRIFKPDQPGDDPELTPQSYGVFEPDDKNDNGQNNIYDFLPASDILDQSSVTTLIQHETIHAALQEGEASGKLSPEEIALVGKACGTLRDAALEESSYYMGDVADRMTYLRNHVDKKYHAAFNKVIDALENGTFNKLPVNKDASEVPECLVQTPIQALNAVIAAEGINDDKLTNQLLDGKLGDVTAAVVDDWQQMIIEDTIYEHLREADYVPDNKDNELFGHPYNNSDETLTTFADIAFRFPEQVGDHLIDMDPAVQKATDTLVEVVANRLKTTYANDPAMVKWVSDRYAAYQAARKNA